MMLAPAAAASRTIFSALSCMVCVAMQQQQSSALSERQHATRSTQRAAPPAIATRPPPLSPGWRQVPALSASGWQQPSPGAAWLLIERWAAGGGGEINVGVEKVAGLMWLWLLNAGWVMGGVNASHKKKGVTQFDLGLVSCQFDARRFALRAQGVLPSSA
jgi:hypothetical protein